MGRTAKALIAIFILLGILVVGGFGTVWYMFQRSDKALLREHVKAREDGARFGKSAEDRECAKPALVHLRKDNELFAGADAMAFMEQCLKYAERTAPFCDGVPAVYELIDAAAWQHKQCEDAGYADAVMCDAVFGEVTKECQRRSIDAPKEE